MSNEVDDENEQVNFSARSHDHSTDEVLRPSSSRLSSASRRKQHEEEEQRRRRSPKKTDEHFSDQISPSKSSPINDNQSFNDHDDQPTIHDHLHPSLDVNQLTHDGPQTDLDDDDHHHQIIPDANHHENVKSSIGKEQEQRERHPSCQFKSAKWLDLQFHSQKTETDSTTGPIKRPNELEDEMEDPPAPIDEKLLDRVQGSIVGLTLGDALGAHVEFRPHEYMKEHPVSDLEGGGTWGLEKGQFTDDASMALCLANSLLARKDFIPYDQLVRYKWWSRHGYMSSTGQCFDIGAATSQSIHEFEYRQKVFSKEKQIPLDDLDHLSDMEILSEFDVDCSEEDAAGNGALMRLAPVPLFFFRNKYCAVEFSGISGRITHGAKQAYDACRFYGALIVAALNGYSKKQILAPNFYSKHQRWFGDEPLHDEIMTIAKGSYKRPQGYKHGIRGKGYIVSALEAALWAFWSDEESFEKGVLAAVNLGDDTDTTAAIYGQLAGAYYGFKNLPERWINQIYALNYMKQLSKWIVHQGEQWSRDRKQSSIRQSNK